MQPIYPNDNHWSKASLKQLLPSFYPSVRMSTRSMLHIYTRILSALCKANLRHTAQEYCLILAQSSRNSWSEAGVLPLTPPPSLASSSLPIILESFLPNGISPLPIIRDENNRKESLLRHFSIRNTERSIFWKKGLKKENFKGHKIKLQKIVDYVTFNHFY